MPIVKVIKGDLIDLFKQGKFEVIGHGANCMNIMGAGIAAQISKQFPKALESDAEVYSNHGGKSHVPVNHMGGQISVAHVNNGIVANLYTQVRLGADADYQLLQNACYNLNKWCKGRSIVRVGLPLIGCGIGLDIIPALTIIGACTPDIDVTIVVWEKDEESMNIAKKYVNFAMPRLFSGLATMVTPDYTFDIYTKKTGEWVNWSGDLKEISVMHHHGDRALSLSDSDSEIYLLVNGKDNLQEVSRLL